MDVVEVIVTVGVGVAGGGSSGRRRRSYGRNQSLVHHTEGRVQR